MMSSLETIIYQKHLLKITVEPKYGFFYFRLYQKGEFKKQTGVYIPPLSGEKIENHYEYAITMLLK
jgi:hypothetical protein